MSNLRSGHRVGGQRTLKEFPGVRPVIGMEIFRQWGGIWIAFSTAKLRNIGISNDITVNVCMTDRIFWPFEQDGAGDTMKMEV